MLIIYQINFCCQGLWKVAQIVDPRFTRNGCCHVEIIGRAGLADGAGRGLLADVHVAWVEGLAGHENVAVAVLLGQSKVRIAGIDLIESVIGIASRNETSMSRFEGGEHMEEEGEATADPDRPEDCNQTPLPGSTPAHDMLENPVNIFPYTNNRFRIVHCFGWKKTREIGRGANQTLRIG